MERENNFFEYQYCVLRYAQDRGSGEALNIGVVVYCSPVRFLRSKINHLTKRLSDAFADFDAGLYRRVTGGFEQGVEDWNDQYSVVRQGSFDFRRDPPTGIEQVIRGIWPDLGMSYHVGEASAGIAEDLEQEMEALYFTFVGSQFLDSRRPKRDDEDVWNVYQNALRSQSFAATTQLVPNVFAVDEFEFKFKHTFKNGVHQVLEPVSLDYADKASIRNRVERLLGEAQILRDQSTLGTMYLLLGRPSNSENMQAYQTAVKNLKTLVIDHEIVEEEHADDFARRLVAQMKQYGLVKEDNGQNEAVDQSRKPLI